MDVDGNLGGLHHSGILLDLNLEIEYLIMDDFMAVTLKSNNMIMADGQFKFVAEKDQIRLDNGMTIRVEERGAGYILNYEDHTVHIMPI